MPKRDYLSILRLRFNALPLSGQAAVGRFLLEHTITVFEHAIAPQLQKQLEDALLHGEITPCPFCGRRPCSCPQACTRYAEDPNVCDDTGAPKGQCINCGFPDTDHSAAE